MCKLTVREIVANVIIGFMFFSQSASYAATDLKSPDENCGNPLDVKHEVDSYTEKNKKVLFHLYLVEKRHYTDYLPFLNKVSISKNDMRVVLTNMDYTLRHFPNHHGALYVIARLEKRLGGKLPQEYYLESPGDWYRSMGCYFERARRYQPNDPDIYLVYALYLHSVKRYSQALISYKISEDLNADSVELKYNLGLLYFDTKKYKLAKKYATQAYTKGFSLNGLKNKLRSKNMWP